MTRVLVLRHVLDDRTENDNQIRTAAKRSENSGLIVFGQFCVTASFFNQKKGRFQTIWRYSRKFSFVWAIRVSFSV